MNLFLVRHGECSEEKGIYLGSGSDVSINRLGMTQIETIGLALKRQIEGVNTLMFSSSLRRSIESSDILSKELDIIPIIDSRLNEINFGLWEGLNYEQIMARWSGIATVWYNNPMDITPPSGEPFTKFYTRIKSFLSELVSKYNDENIILVTHGGVIQLLLTILNSDTIDNRWKYNIGRGEFLKFNV